MSGDRVALAEQGACAVETGAGTRSPQAYARIVLAIALVGLGAWTLRSFLPALVWAAIFAIATWPTYERVQRRWPPGRHNILMPSLFTFGVALLFIVPLALVALQLGREAHTALEWVGQARTEGVSMPDWIGQLPLIGAEAASWWAANLADPQGSAELLGRLGHGEVVSFSRQLGAQVIHRLVLFGFTLLALFFLFRDGHRLGQQMLTASRRAFGPGGERVGRQIIASVHGTVDGLVLVGIGEGVVLGLAYYVVGVPHPALLGAVTALAAMIPFGAPLVFGIASLLLLAQDSLALAVALSAFGFAVVFVADHFVRPFLIGGATRLPFVWVLLGILGGVETWGLLGLFLGPAIMAALILLWREWTDPATPTRPLAARDEARPGSGED